MIQACLVAITVVLRTVFGSLPADPARDSPRPAPINFGAASQPTPNLPELGMAEDLRLLRKTIDDAGDRVSAPQAFHAAARIFGRVNFVGMTKQDVLWMLGDPATLNDYGFKRGPGADDPLVYRFDQGGRGRCYFVEFANGRVTRASKPRQNQPTLRQVDTELAPRQPQAGMAKDLRLIRKTADDPQSDSRFSSMEAKQAAHRIFGRINFVGMTRTQVLWMLGDPATLSDFTSRYRPKPEHDASLVYTFYNNAGGGRCYIVRFENDRVTHVHGKTMTHPE